MVPPRVARRALHVAQRWLSTRPTADFIASGPIFREARLPRPAGDELRRWHELGDSILTDDSEEALRRTYHLSLPVYFYLKHLHSQPRRNPAAQTSADRAPPLLVGLQCLQGGGKTTSALQVPNRH